jgi:tRNA G18 (ribose-2'-O)-methylase SpoU
VSKSILALADEVVKIPMLGKKESLNVAVAASVALYDLNLKR